MKNNRHGAILGIISSNRIRTQAELRERLLEMGYDVTQATLSRDINELGLVKSEECYSVPSRNVSELPPLLTDSVTQIDHAGNTVVFKCHAGMANAACATFDRLEQKGVVGTLAGDDTIFILMRTDKEAAAFAARMKNAIFKKDDTDAC
ncbi:MAG: arginine repressor [Huintestinicola sp.]